MEIFIKNMVCSRCKMVVKSEFEKLGFQPSSVELGKVDIVDSLNNSDLTTLNENLKKLGFEVLDDKKSRTIERIKNLIVELVHCKNNELNTNLSDYLSRDLLHDYNTLSKMFSESEGITIEHYFIAQKIEKVKELLTYDELTLSEIADQLNYSSTAYLSNQFKKITGLTTSAYKAYKFHNRTNLEEL